MRSIIKILIGLAYGIALDGKILTLDTLVYPILKNIANITNSNNKESKYGKEKRNSVLQQQKNI